MGLDSLSDSVDRVKKVGNIKHFLFLRERHSILSLKVAAIAVVAGLWERRSS